MSEIGRPKGRSFSFSGSPGFPKFLRFLYDFMDQLADASFLFVVQAPVRFEHSNNNFIIISLDFSHDPGKLFVRVGFVKHFAFPITDPYPRYTEYPADVRYCPFAGLSCTRT